MIAPSVGSVPRARRCAVIAGPERFKIAPSEVVFVSANRWDVMGAGTFGFRMAWINRTHLPAEYEPAPDATLAGLDELITMAP